MVLDSKMIIIDIDFPKINFDNADVFNNIKHLLNKISGYQHLILLTNENLKDALNYISTLELRTGYLVANSGAVIYSIGSSKTLFEKKIGFFDAQAIAHIATMKDLPLVVNDRHGTKASYKINEWTNKTVMDQLLETKKDPIKIYESYSQFEEQIKVMNINSIELHLSKHKNEMRNQKLNDLLVEITKVVEVDLFWLDKRLFITPKNATRLHALMKLSNILRLNLLTSGLYVGAVSFYNKMINYCYSCVTSREVFNDCKDLLTGKPPTIFYRNGLNAWVNWLKDYDYLWSYQPHTQLDEKLNRYDLSFSESQIDNLSDQSTKVIQINKENQQIIVNNTDHSRNKKTSKLQKLFWSKEQLRNNDDYNDQLETILIWNEDKQGLIKQITEKEKQ